MMNCSGYYHPEAVKERIAHTQKRLAELETLLRDVTTQRTRADCARVREQRQRYEEVARLKGQGLNWAQIGRKLGITRQGAKWIYDNHG